VQVNIVEILEKGCRERSNYYPQTDFLPYVEAVFLENAKPDIAKDLLYCTLEKYMSMNAGGDLALWSILERLISHLLERYSYLPDVVVKELISNVSSNPAYEKVLAEWVVLDEQLSQERLKSLFPPYTNVGSKKYAMLIALRLAKYGVDMPHGTESNLLSTGTIYSATHTYDWHNGGNNYHLYAIELTSHHPNWLGVQHPHLNERLREFFPKVSPTYQNKIKEIARNADLKVEVFRRWESLSINTPVIVPEEEITSQTHNAAACFEKMLQKDAEFAMDPIDHAVLQRSLKAMIANGWTETVLCQLLEEKIPENDALPMLFSWEKAADYHVAPDSFDRKGRTAFDLMQEHPSQEWRHLLSELIHYHRFYLPKKLPELLEELKELNPDNPSLLQRIEEGYFLKTIQLVASLQKKTNAPLKTAGTIVGHFTHWKDEDFKQWRQSFAEGTHRVEEQNTAEIMAILSEVAHRTLFKHKGHLREVQLLAILALNDSPDGGLAQIATGEGKSIIIAAFAAMQVLAGRKIDIITSSETLATRDLSKQAAFYKLLGISADHNINVPSTAGLGPKPCYLADVLYGSLLYFIGDTLRDITLNTKLGRGYDLVIVDEVDNMFVDQTKMKVQLSSAIAGFEMLRPIFAYMWGTSMTIASMLHPKEDQCYYHLPSRSAEEHEKYLRETPLAEMEEAEEEVYEAVPIASNCNRFLYDYIQNYTTNQLLALHTPKEQRLLVVPSHLEEFVQKHLPRWMQSLFAAYNHQEKLEYLVYDVTQRYNASSERPPLHVIAPVDYKNTGVIQHGLKWTDGLHQFLELKHGVTLHAETLISVFMSYIGYILHYKGNIYGVSGTLGNKIHYEFLKHTYGVDSAIIPTFIYKDIQMAVPVIANSKEQWEKEIIRTIQHKIIPYQAGLVICESIEQAEHLAALFKPHHYNPGLIHIYGRGTKHEEALIERPLQPGEVLFATNMAGRGTDLGLDPKVVKQGGLYVIMTSFLESSRATLQGLGRGGRKGEPGTAQLITYEDQVCDYPCPTYSINCLEEAREKQETQRLQEDRHCTIPAMQLQDDLFDLYVQFIKKWSSPTGYALVLVHSDTIPKPYMLLKQEQQSLMLTLYGAEGAEHLLNITDMLETLDHKVTQHMRTLLANPKSTVASFNQQAEELLHFIVASQGHSHHEDIYDRVVAIYKNTLRETLPDERRAESGFWDSLSFTITETAYLRWLLTTDEAFSDLQQIPFTEDEALLGQVRLRKLYQLWLEDRKIYNKEFEVKQITDYWAMWLKEQENLLMPSDVCLFSTDQERQQTQKRFAQLKIQLTQAFTAFQEKTERLPDFMQNPTYLIEMAWRYWQIDAEQTRTGTHPANITPVYQNTMDWLGGLWQQLRKDIWSAWDYTFQGFSVRAPLDKAIEFIELSLRGNPVDAWVGHNALSVIRLARDGKGITNEEDIKTAARVKNRYAEDVQQSIRHIMDFTPSLESQLNFLLMHQQIVPQDPLAVQLIGTLRIYEQIIESMQRNLATVARAQGNEMIRLVKFSPLEEIVAAMDINDAIRQIANKTEGVRDLGRGLLFNSTALVVFASKQMVIDEIVASGALLFEIELYPLEKEKQSWFDTFFTAMLGVGQIIMGISIMSTGCIFANSFGLSMIFQGLGDIISAGFAIANNRPLSMEHYVNSKGMSIAIAITTAGLLHFAGSLEAVQKLELLKNLSNMSSNSITSGFLAKTAVAQISASFLAQGIYQMAKPLVDDEQIEYKAQEAVKALLRDHAQLLQEIFATDAWKGNHNLAAAITEGVQRIADDYKGRFHDDGSTFATNLVGNVGSSLLGAPMLGNAFNMGGRALMGAIKNAESIGTIMGKAHGVIENAHQRRMGSAAMFREALHKDFGDQVTAELMHHLSEQAYVTGMEIPYQDCASFLQALLPSTLTLYQPAMVSTCEKVARIKQADYGPSFDTLQNSLTDFLTGTISYIQHKEILGGVTDSLGQIAGAELAERALEYLKAKQQQAKAETTETDSPKPARKKMDTEKVLEESGVKKPQAKLPNVTPQKRPVELENGAQHSYDTLSAEQQKIYRRAIKDAETAIDQSNTIMQAAKDQAKAEVREALLTLVQKSSVEREKIIKALTVAKPGFFEGWWNDFWDANAFVPAVGSAVLLAFEVCATNYLCMIGITAAVGAFTFKPNFAKEDYTIDDDSSIFQRKKGTDSSAPKQLTKQEEENQPQKDPGGPRGHKIPSLPSVKDEEGSWLDYDDADYHHQNSRNGKSPAPTNGKKILEEFSFPLGGKSKRRLGFDPETNEITVFDQTRHDPNTNTNTFHGHVKSWKELPDDMKKAFQDAGIFNHRGKPVPK
jgi:superfamily II DNA or RNA helicase